MWALHLAAYGILNVIQSDGLELASSVCLRYLQDPLFEPESTYPIKTIAEENAGVLPFIQEAEQIETERNGKLQASLLTGSA